MLFNSPEYFVFLIVVLIIYYSLGHRFQNFLLLVASYVFYGFWDYRFLSLIMLSTMVDYLAGRSIYRTTIKSRRRLFLSISLAVNLGILSTFKYFNFFSDNAARLLDFLGFQVSLPVLYIILPVGISFYTFQTMAYTIEVYRERMKPVDHFLDFALYVCYFPQLVAGPIERPQNLLPAIQSRRTVNTEQFVSGAVLILIGLVRKVVIADGIGPQIDPIFEAPANYSTPELLKGLYLFALQIYCDFAGYSDIARGTSRILGIELMENFSHPYFAANITEFWRRWHISLSTWLRDYLYIPLGGNRNGAFNTYKNLMITMLLGGLWHGAAWSFIFWGGLHGLYLMAHRMLSRIGKTAQFPEILQVATRYRVTGAFITFHFVLLTWVFFRTPGLYAAINFLKGVVTFRNMETWSMILPSMIIPWFLLLCIDVPQFLVRDHTFLLRWPKPVRDLTVAIMLFIIILGIGSRAPFIYFQF